MKKYLVVLIMLLSTTFVFANPQKEVVEKQGPEVIELWSSLSSKKASVFDQQVAEFNASQDEVVVNVVHQGGYSILRQKIAASAASNTMPTLLICDYLDVAWYAQLGLIIPLDDIISDSTINDYYSSMLNDLKYDGSLYAIPYNRSTQGFFVNNDLLRKAGIDSPAKTWDEFEEHATKMKELGDDYYYAYAFFHQFIYDAIAQSFGADISSVDGEVRLNSPEMIKMFTYFQNLYKENKLLMQPVLLGGFEEQNGAFLNGNVATVFQTTSFLPTANKLLTSDWSFEFMPAGDGGHAITIGGGNFGIGSQSTDAQKKAAAKFLEYMSSDDVVTQFFMETGNLPTKKSIMNRDDVKAYLEKDKNIQKLIDQLQYGKSAPSVTKNIRDIFMRTNDIISRIILDGQDVVTVLNEYNAEFQAEIDEAKANGEFIK